jgi:hypothetical protein
MRTYHLFTLFGLKTTISPVGILSFIFVIPLLALLAASTTTISFGAAMLAGGLAAALMLISEWAHQLGHAFAARRLGYPMIGIHVHSIFGASIYPPDEPPLPPAIHIRRALGGFWVNLVIGLFLMPYAFFLWFDGGVRGWVVAFTTLYNFFILGLGSLFPIDIPGRFTNDGGTLLRLWREGRAGTKQ